MFKNSLLKLWYKIFSRSKYQDLKYEEKLDEKLKYYKSKIYDKILEIQNNIENK